MVDLVRNKQRVDPNRPGTCYKCKGTVVAGWTSSGRIGLRYWHSHCIPTLPHPVEPKGDVKEMLEDIARETQKYDKEVLDMRIKKMPESLSFDHNGLLNDLPADLSNGKYWDPFNHEEYDYE